MNTNGIKVTKESLPTLVEKVRSKTSKSINMLMLKDGHPLEGFSSTLNSPKYIDDVVVKLNRSANLPEGCGEVFVEII